MGCTHSTKSKTTSQVTQPLSKSPRTNEPDTIENLKTCCSADANDQPPQIQQTLQQMILDSFPSYSRNRCIVDSTASRETHLSPRSQGLLMKTYKQVFNNAQRIGSAFLNLNLAPVQMQNKCEYRFFGTISEKREEVIELEIASCVYGLTMVPLDLDVLDIILYKTEMTTVFCSKTGLNLLISAIKRLRVGGCSILNLVCFDQPSSEQIQDTRELGINLLEWTDLMQRSYRLADYPQFEDSSTLFSLDLGKLVKNRDAPFRELGRTHKSVAQNLEQIMDVNTVTACKLEVIKEGHIRIEKLYSSTERILCLGLLSAGLTIGLPSQYY